MKYTPSDRPKCRSLLDKGPGRPTRWCSEGCKRSGEDELSRLSSPLKALESERVDIRQRGGMPERTTEIIDDLQHRFDHLAGVPN
jgi:hypothetical protein